MLTFWIVTVLLLLLTLALLAPVLLGNRKLVDADRDRQNIQIAHDRIAELERERDDGVMSPEEFEQAKREVESALLIDVDQREEGDGVRISGVGKGTFAALIVLLPLLSGLLYLQLGEPSLIDPQPGHSEGFDLSSEGSIEEMIRKLALRLQENPEDAEGWFLMGRTMMVLDQYRHAVTAFENTLDLVGEEPSLLLALADALAMAEGGTMAGQRTKELVERALELEPANVTALWMAGMVSEERGDTPPRCATGSGCSRCCAMSRRRRPRLGSGLSGYALNWPSRNRQRLRRGMLAAPRHSPAERRTR